MNYTIEIATSPNEDKPGVFGMATTKRTTWFRILDRQGNVYKGWARISYRGGSSYSALQAVIRLLEGKKV